LVVDRGFSAARLASDDLFPDDRASRFEIIRESLARLGPEALASAILVDDRDDRNLELAIAMLAIDSRLPVTVSMFNESIAPHLRAANPAVRTLTPARTAAPAFGGALAVPPPHDLRSQPVPPMSHRRPRRADLLIRWLVAGFAGLLLAAISFFH